MSLIGVSERRHTASARDLDLLAQMLAASDGVLPPSEHMENDNYLDAVIEKPWGYECRVYADCFYDIWHLCLRSGQSTSLHCHPRKTTMLLCLAGSGLVHFLEQEQEVTALQALHIGKGVFHSTENRGKGDLELIEVELPRNKLDLLRASDRYGRQQTPYEQQSKVVEIAPLHIAREIPPYRLRPSGGAYRFAVQLGATLRSQATEEPVVSVALDVASALRHEIQVHTGFGHTGELHPQTSYFTIAL